MSHKPEQGNKQRQRLYNVEQDYVIKALVISAVLQKPP
jgi:hypothetical protein